MKKKDEEKNFYNSFRSGIPPHLTPEELEEWEKEAERTRQETERRKKEGSANLSKPKKRIKFKKGRRSSASEMRPFYDM